MKDGKTYLTDSVPFSCCDPRVRRPCVHHSMLSSFQHTKYDSSNVTVYEIGCKRAISNHYAATVTGFLKLLVACLVVELALTVIFRYLQTSIGTAIEEDDIEGETRGYLWTVSKKKPASSGGKTSPTKATGKRDKTPARKGAAKSSRDKNQSNVGPNNNSLWSKGGEDMVVSRVGPPSEAAEKGLSKSERRGAETGGAYVTRMPSSASRQTSATNVSGSSRRTSGTRLTVTSSHDSANVVARSASKQPSYSSVTSRAVASTSGVRPRASRSTSFASTAKPGPNMSLNNNANAAPGSLSTSPASQHPLQSDCASDLPAKVHYPQQHDVDVEQSSRPEAQHNVEIESERPPEVPRPLTPISKPEVNLARAASARLPRSIPLADYLAPGRSSLGQTGSTQRTSGHVMRCDGAKGTSRTNAATQPPPTAVHKPAVAQPVAGVHVPSNYRTVPTGPGSSTVPAPPLPRRNRPTTEHSPYVMIYPLRPPRSQPVTSTESRTE